MMDEVDILKQKIEDERIKHKKELERIFKFFGRSNGIGVIPHIIAAGFKRKSFFIKAYALLPWGEIKKEACCPARCLRRMLIEKLILAEGNFFLR